MSVNSENILKIPKVLETKENTSTINMGIGYVLCYYSIYIYSLYTSIRKKCIGSSVVTHGKKNFTLSQALYNSDPNIVVFLNLLYLFICIYISYKKNLFKLDINKIIIVLSFISIPLLYISLIYIKDTVPIHYLIALSIFLISVVSTYLIYTEYTKYYIDNDGILNAYYVLLCVYFIFGVFIVILFTYKFYLTVRGKNTLIGNSPSVKFNRFTTDLLGISEYSSTTIYGILIYMFITLPNLPNDQ